MDEHADARMALFSRLIDHAPLFPPASLPLPLPEAIAESARLAALAAKGLWANVLCGGSSASGTTKLATIGSCSFFEPVEELEALGDLPL